jgi:hypothetical protein
VEYFPHPAVNLKERPNLILGLEGIVSAGPDGMFRLAVPTGRGQLLVHGPTDDYLAEVTKIPLWQPYGIKERWFYANRAVPLDVAAGRVRKVSVVLRKGVTFTVRVVGPSGAPMTSGLFICPSRVSPIHRSTGGFKQLPVRDGRLELPGCDPGRIYTVLVFDAKRRCGAIVELTGKRAAGASPIRLAPYVQTSLRFKDKAGAPVRGVQVRQVVVIPADRCSGREWRPAPGAPTALAYDMLWVDPVRYEKDPKSDGEGRVILPGLVPGARYATEYRAGAGWQSGPQFTAPQRTNGELPSVVIGKR